MQLVSPKDVEDFKRVVSECEGDVCLVSNEGDRFNLKSTLSVYTAIGALLSERSADLELYCSRREDEQRFLKFFYEHPETL